MICELTGGHGSRIVDVEPLANGNLASGAAQGRIVFWLVGSKKKLFQIDNAHNGGMKLKQLASNSNYLASGGKNKVEN